MPEKNSEFYLQYLQDQDDPKYFEYPQDFSLSAAEEEFSEIVLSFAKLWQMQLVPGQDFMGDFQDCTFHGQLKIPEKFCLNLRPEQEDIWIVFSNFGRLVIIDDPEHNLKSEVQKEICDFLAAQEYEFIPEEIINLPYQGPWEKSTHPPYNWQARFFDYS